MKKFSFLYAALLVVLMAAPFVGAYPVFVMKLLCLALFASAFNLLMGYTGLLSFGHAAFFGGSAYATGYAVKAWGLTPEFAILFGVLYSIVLGWVFGVLAIRRQGIYFAMITLALAQLMFFVALQLKLTGGEDGLQGVPRGKLFGFVELSSDLTMYYFVLTMCVAGFLFIYRTIHSPFGQVLRGIKENEARSLSLGYNVDRFKLLAFVLSAGLTGLAGSLKTLVLGFATLTDVHWTASGEVILVTLVGGLGTLSGPLIGASVVVLLENKLGELGAFLARAMNIEWFNTLNDSVPMVTGLIFVVCVLAFRRGIAGEILSMLARKPAPARRAPAGAVGVLPPGLPPQDLPPTC